MVALVLAACSASCLSYSNYATWYLGHGCGFLHQFGLRLELGLFLDISLYYITKGISMAKKKGKTEFSERKSRLSKLEYRLKIEEEKRKSKSARRRDG